MKQSLEQCVELIRKLQSLGYTAVLAGGCVRDRVIERDPEAYEIVTSATADQVEEIIGRQTYICHSPDHRQDIPGLPAHGGSIDFTNDLKKYASHCDFTINAMFWDPIKDEILDYHGGMEDISTGVIRAVGSARERLSEDHLRMLTAIGLSSQLSFDLCPELVAEISRQSSQIASVDQERVRDQLFRILELQNNASALPHLLRTGLLSHILPEVSCLSDVEQDPIHHPEGDALIHSLGVLKTLTEMNVDVTLRFAGLLHDIGKSKCQQIRYDEQGRRRISALGHDTTGAEMADDVSKRLKLPNEDAEKINFLVANHMRAHTGRKMRKPTLVKFLRHPNVLDLIKLQHADGENSGHDDKSCLHFYLEKMETLKPLIMAEPIIKRDCLISGADLIELGLNPGPQFRTLFDYCDELQDAGLISTHSDAIAAVKERLDTETTSPPSVATASDRPRNDGS